MDGRGGVNGIRRQLWQENIYTYCVRGRKLLFIEAECSVNDE